MGNVEVGPGEKVWLSKLDGEAFFDQLSLSPALIPYMGRPAVSVASLLNIGDLTLDDIQSSILDDTTVSETSWVTPVNLTWSMGISWSSLVAQSTMVHCVLDSGYVPGQFLTEEHSLPDDPRDAVAVATDDIGVMVVGNATDGPDKSIARARRVASSLQAAGIKEKIDKRLEGSPDGTLLGIQLVDGHRLQTPANKMVDLMTGFVDLTGRASAAPSDVHSLQASCQWYCLLHRPLLACFHQVYDFVRLEPRTSPRTVPTSVMDEIALSLALAPLWAVDLRTPWLERLIASDASDAFGFGVCSAPCPADIARRAGSQCARREDHVRLIQVPGDEPEKPRLGSAYRIPLAMSQFKVLASKRAKHKDHSGGLEATALELAMDLLSRDGSAHASRVTFLVDARAVLFAAEKGRSSSQTLRRPLRRIAALTLACGWLAHFAYVPSESNPADAPSRGVVPGKDKARQTRRLTLGTNGRAPRFTQLQQHLRQLSRDHARLMDGPNGAFLASL